MLLRNLQIVEELSHWKDNSFILRCSREKGEKDLGWGGRRGDRKEILYQKCKETTFKKCWRDREHSKYRKRDREKVGSKGLHRKEENK